MSFVLYTIMGLAWVAAYALIIRRTHLDKVAAIPLVAVAVNITWEYLYSFLFFFTPFIWAVGMLWFLFDAVVLTQFFTYGTSRQLLQRTGVVFLTIAVAAPMLIWAHGAGFTAIQTGSLQNLAMSLLFVLMVLSRPGIAGTSIYIGICKALGTWIVIIPAWITPGMSEEWYMPLTFAGIILFDLLYTGVVWARTARTGINPLKRL